MNGHGIALVQLARDSDTRPSLDLTLHDTELNEVDRINSHHCVHACIRRNDSLET